MLYKSRFVILSTILFTSIFFCLPFIADWIVSDPIYAKYAGQDASRMVSHIQKALIFPFGQWLSTAKLSWIVVPYFFLLFIGVRYLFRFKKFWKAFGIVSLTYLIFLYIFPNTLLLLESDQPSIVQGSVGNGSIKNAKRMNFRGGNFTTYSFACYLAGRTFVHGKVRKVMLDSYQACETSCPGITFVVGETGLRKGGHFPPHRTHRNGMSVDFMTPLLKNKTPFRSNHIFNLWGYRFEFDNKGIKGNLEIDYETMARHLIALEAAAKQNGLKIQKVIFDPVLRPYLLNTPSGKKIKHLPFTKNRVVIRHDDHYHIDFGITIIYPKVT